ncbi:DUF4450 domain-containing protein [Sphingobacterium sp. LRF_L2]|uniref:DUF4450 domain-containing protein n=1 Tax=Sphingobacterium sp. LRF_L2 TaxID=3369421 RepID=UPI003F60E404
MRGKSLFSCCLLFYLSIGLLTAQSRHWQKNDRQLHYTEDQGDFLLVDGKYRFNRALYGDNRASRVEAGDLPEFALYLPGMAGNLQFVVQQGDVFRKLIEAKHIETRYRPGAMLYKIQDPVLGKGYLHLTVLAQANNEGMVVKLEAKGLPKSTAVYCIYGGASGKTFSRNGDIGADPESGFYLLPAYAIYNSFTLDRNNFSLRYLGKREEELYVNGSFTSGGTVGLSDAHALSALSTLENANKQGSPIVYAKYTRFDKPIYMQVSKGYNNNASSADLSALYAEADQARLAISNRIKLRTPDRYINNFGAALAIAADGIWENPTFLHGAVAWRMRLNAWRGAYTADALGWHERAKAHFSSYANSQVLEPVQGPVVMDTALHLARHLEKMGTSVFTSGYISRNPNNNTVPHHYDMNLVFFDQLFSHFDYTGDRIYLKKMWPTIVRHLDWEKRNFDRDADGLYDAYCAIWASDGLQYAGGDVAHTSAYNYRANRAAAKIADLLGEDSTPYQVEAEKIGRALRDRLWLAEKGYFAEYQDALGNRLLHDKPGLWTIYHVADAFLLDEFESYQNLQYVQNHSPKIPISVTGMQHEGLYTLATTNWQPYTWSVNNVALAENLQTALAYWQSGRNEDAYVLWKSNLIESMYHGISPGNFQQLSHYDAFRGELYRDFADPIGVASRTLVEGLFGMYPQLLDKEILVKPGFPASWDFAEIALPEWRYAYKKKKDRVQFDIHTSYQNPVKLKMEVPISYTRIRSVKINGKQIDWAIKEQSIHQPILVFEGAVEHDFSIEIAGEGQLELASSDAVVQRYTEPWVFSLKDGQELLDVYDPQKMVQSQEGNQFRFAPKKHTGTFFLKLKEGQMNWWHPVNMELVEPVSHRFERKENKHLLCLKNNTDRSIVVQVQAPRLKEDITLSSRDSAEIEIPTHTLSKGTNRYELGVDGIRWTVDYYSWDIAQDEGYIQTDLSSFYNARVQQIFEQRYLSPRPEGPTLQLPWQGIGNWCYPLVTASIDDSGLMAARKKDVVTYLEIPFLISGNSKNVLFTSQWDNYPTSITVPLQGKAEKVYLLMAGSTNPMQSQLVNAYVRVRYTDGEESLLPLKNPTNWWPIEQDYLDDNYAFEIPDDLVPYRVKLKTGELYKGGQLAKYSDIKGFSNRGVDGGAATIVDLPLDATKTLQSLTLMTEANDVVVGLIAATLWAR